MIDLIIPVHNNEKTLKRLIASLMAQTRQDNFRAIFIDDNSEDNSVTIITELAQEFEFAGILGTMETPSNGSPGLVRQYGIDCLEENKGEYIAFLDADDELMPYAFEQIQFAIEYYNHPDMIISPIYTNNGNSYKLLDTKESLTWLHGKIYKRSFLEEHNIKFFSGFNEDGAFNTIATSFTQPSEINMVLYLWRDNKDSITRKIKDFNLKYFNDYIDNNIKSYLQIKNELGIENKNLRTRLISMLTKSYKYINEALIKGYNTEKIEDMFNKIQELVDKLDYNSIFSKEITELEKHILVIEDKQFLCMITIYGFLNKLGLDWDLRPKAIIDGEDVNEQSEDNSN